MMACTAALESAQPACLQSPSEAPPVCSGSASEAPVTHGHALFQVRALRSTAPPMASPAPAMQQMVFEPMDGGADRACRGSGPEDDLPSHFELHTGVATLDACKDLCEETPTCGGIEYNAAFDNGRCEVWTRPGGIGSTVQVPGSTCLRHGPPADPFEPADGGADRACRGAVPSDNSPNYYTLHEGVASLGACKALCTSADLCTGIEYAAGYDGGRCEVWTRRGGISATVQLPGVVCLKHGPSSEEFVPADNATRRVCRGADAMDDSPSYYMLHTAVPSLSACQALCMDAPVCKGIEYIAGHQGGRCEVWTRPGGIEATSVSELESTCLRTRSEHFDLVDGSTNRACRGSLPEDDSHKYYVLHMDVPSLDACKALCADAPICTGIEYSPQHDGGRCEVWTRPGGVSATLQAPGSLCLRYGPSTEQFRPIDGGVGRVCRGTSPSDDAPAYYVLHTGVPSLGACEAICIGAAVCRGIEYAPQHDGGRCEVWTRPGGVRASRASEGSTCLRYGTLTEQFHLMDGGADRACRGAGPSDNAPGHYVLHAGVASLAACRALCVEAPVCKGVEYSPAHDGGRCEVWTRRGGIRATQPRNGTTCLQYGTSAKHFQLVDGGSNRACRVSTAGEEPAVHVLHTNVSSLDSCAALCVAAPKCGGVEYNAGFDGGRCEVWAEKGGVVSTVPSSGSTCLRYATSTEQFEPMDGGSGRACRGVVPTDDSESYYAAHGDVASLEACMQLCAHAPVCKGIEYHAGFDGGRCEVWTRTGGISATAPSNGTWCFTYGPPTEQFAPAGNETNQACRGASPDDSSPSYYVLHKGVASLSACQNLCIDARVCKGVEYSAAFDGGRCEVWTRPGGIEAVAPATGSTCLRYGAAAGTAGGQ